MKRGRKRKYDFASLRIGKTMTIPEGNANSIRAAAAEWSGRYADGKRMFSVTSHDLGGVTVVVIRRIK